MNIRDMRIGLRLGLGFGMILLAASILLVGSLVSNGNSRATVLGTLQRAAAQQDLAEKMRRTLLSSAVSVRNMGLQSKVEAVQKDEVDAKRQRAAYLVAKGRLEADGMGDKEREIFSKLADIDQQMDAQFKEAVDLASQFNTEQALSSNQTTANVIAGAGVLVLVLAGLMAWSLTNSITTPLKTALDATGRVAQGHTNSREETQLLLAGLLEMRNGLVRMVGEVRSGAENIATGANEIAAGNTDLSQRTENQASNLEETASSMQDLSNNVKNNAETARQANQMASSASAAAAKGGGSGEPGGQQLQTGWRALSAALGDFLTRQAWPPGTDHPCEILTAAVRVWARWSMKAQAILQRLTKAGTAERLLSGSPLCRPCQLG